MAGDGRTHSVRGERGDGGRIWDGPIGTIVEIPVRDDRRRVVRARDADRSPGSWCRRMRMPTRIDGGLPCSRDRSARASATTKERQVRVVDPETARRDAHVLECRVPIPHASSSSSSTGDSGVLPPDDGPRAPGRVDRRPPSIAPGGVRHDGLDGLGEHGHEVRPRGHDLRIRGASPRPPTALVPRAAINVLPSLLVNLLHIRHAPGASALGTPRRSGHSGPLIWAVAAPFRVHRIHPMIGRDLPALMATRRTRYPSREESSNPIPETRSTKPARRPSTEPSAGSGTPWPAPTSSRTGRSPSPCSTSRSLVRLGDEFAAFRDLCVHRGTSAEPRLGRGRAASCAPTTAGPTTRRGVAGSVRSTAGRPETRPEGAVRPADAVAARAGLLGRAGRRVPPATSPSASSGRAARLSGAIPIEVRLGLPAARRVENFVDIQPLRLGPPGHPGRRRQPSAPEHEVIADRRTICSTSPRRARTGVKGDVAAAMAKDPARTETLHPPPAVAVRSTSALGPGGRFLLFLASSPCPRGNALVHLERPDLQARSCPRCRVRRFQALILEPGSPVAESQRPEELPVDLRRSSTSGRRPDLVDIAGGSARSPPPTRSAPASRRVSTHDGAGRLIDAGGARVDPDGGAAFEGSASGGRRSSSRSPSCSLA